MRIENFKTMRVILLQDIENVGKKFDIKNMADGYARNFLFPKKLAILATEKEIKKIEILKKMETEKAESDLKKAEEMTEELEGLIFEIPVKSGEDGKLYGSVSAQKISTALKEKGFDIDKKKITIKDPIKELGEYFVFINLAHNLEARITVIVTEEIE